MAQNGYGQFFKTARDVKKGATQPVRKGVSLKGPKVSDVLRSLKSKRSGRKSLPVVPVFTGMIMLLFGIYFYRNMDALEKMLSKIEVRAFGTAMAEDKVAKTSASKEEGTEKSSTAKSPATVGGKSEATTWTPEQLSFFNKLEERKQQLDVREKELQKLEEELQEQKLALEKRLRDLDDLRTKISSRLDEKVKVDQEKVDKLVEFYSNMKPQQAAKVFEDIDEDLAVEILNKMKKKSAADIMNLLKSEKAQKLSEKFAGYKRQ